MTDETDTDGALDDIEWAEASEEQGGTGTTDDGEPLPDEEGSLAATEGVDDETFEEMDEAFEDVAVDDIESDEVWEEVTDEETDLATEEQTTPDEQPPDEDVAEVSKHDYCETCEFFSQAPEIHCTHEGTEILDFPDMESVRVSNCPIVAERQGLEQGVSKGSTDLGDIQRDS